MQLAFWGQPCFLAHLKKQWQMAASCIPSSSKNHHSSGCIPWIKVLGALTYIWRPETDGWWHFVYWHARNVFSILSSPSLPTISSGCCYFLSLQLSLLLSELYQLTYLFQVDGGHIGAHPYLHPGWTRGQERPNQMGSRRSNVDRMIRNI